jgi:hypothetical protein
MDIQMKFKIWLNSELDAMGRGSRKKLAEFLGVPSDAVSRMTNMNPGKEMRDIHISDMVKMFRFFESRPPEIVGALLNLNDDLASRIANADDNEKAALLAFLHSLSSVKNRQ